MFFVQITAENALKSAKTGKPKMSQLDEKDACIIEMLEQDGRKPFKEMAEKLNTSETTVRKRVSALQQKGVIKKFTIKVDHSKLGLNTVAIVGIDVEPSRLLEVAQELCVFKEIRCVATSSGDHMIMIEIWTKDGRALTRLLSEQIGTLNGVRKICPALILEKLKE
jgi:Lrp/AsnC family transcriptional regulator for asnA, asnC and gidA